MKPGSKGTSLKEGTVPNALTVDQCRWARAGMLRKVRE